MIINVYVVIGSDPTDRARVEDLLTDHSKTDYTL